MRCQLCGRKVGRSILHYLFAGERERLDGRILMAKHWRDECPEYRIKGG